MTNGPMRLGATLLFGTAALYGVAAIFGGALTAATCAGVAVLLGLGIWRGWRVLAWLALAVLPVSAAVGAARLGVSALPDYLLWALIVVQGLAALVLFVSLWRPRATPAS